jgi:hypothetical protein
VIDLIGKPYELGADGSGNAIDCIHLVYTVLDRLAIPTPPFNNAWYQAGFRHIFRDLLTWGIRIDVPRYDGDVVLFGQETAAFAITWQTGLLYINQDLKAVAWCPIGTLPISYCFRTKGS